MECFDSQIPDELILTVMQFCSAFELLNNYELVSKRWQNLTQAQFLWRDLCKIRWEGKLNRTLDYDYEQSCIRSNKTWRQLYKEAEIDANRDYITIEDLVNNEWDFQFLYNPLSKQKPHFTYNHELVLPSMGRMQFVMLNAGKLIQVESYPALVVSRSSNWGFFLKNNYVKFETIEKKNPKVKTKEEEEREEKERQRMYTQILISYLLNLYDEDEDENNVGEQDANQQEEEELLGSENEEEEEFENNYEGYEQLE